MRFGPQKMIIQVLGRHVDGDRAGIGLRLDRSKIAPDLDGSGQCFNPDICTLRQESRKMSMRFRLSDGATVITMRPATLLVLISESETPFGDVAEASAFDRTGLSSVGGPALARDAAIFIYNIYRAARAHVQLARHILSGCCQPHRGNCTNY